MSKLSEAAGLLGFEDSPTSSGSETGESGAPDEGQLAAAEDLMDAMKGDSPEKLLSALRSLMDLMD